MNLLYSIVNITLIITPFILLMLLLAPLMDKKLAAGGRLLFWLIAIIGLCSPFVSFIPRPQLQIEVTIPEALERRIQTADESESPQNQSIDSTVPFPDNAGQENEPSLYTAGQYNRSSHPAKSPANVILAAWLTGILISASYHIAAYLRFRRFVRRWGSPETEPEVIASLNDERLRMGISTDIGVFRLKSISSPMLMGFTKPIILLPDFSFESDDLQFILRHELTHYKRRDLWYKLALVVIRSVYWFNPVIHLMAVQANKDLEIVCDTQTINGLDMETRKRYSEMILSMAGGSLICKSQLTTRITGGKHMLQQRFSNILGTTKKNGFALFIILGVAIFAAGLLIGFKFQPKPPESKEAAITASSAIDNETYTPSESGNESFSSAPLKSGNSSFSSALSEYISDTLNTALNDTFNNDNYNPDVSEHTANTLKDNLINEELIDYYSNGDNNVYYDSLDELKDLVFENARMTEREFDDISSLNIVTTGDHISVTQGGDKLTVRYYEWLDNGYRLNVKNGMLILSQNNLPYLRENGSTTNDWLRPYLQSKGKQPYNTVEITVPESVELDLLSINTMSGQIQIKDCDFNDGIILNTMSGTSNIINCASDNISISAMSGFNRIENCASSTIKINSMSGSSYIENCISDYIEIDLMSGSGHITLKDSAENYDVSFDSDWHYLTYNGNRAKNMSNPNAASKIKLSGMSGTFSISDIDN